MEPEESNILRHYCLDWGLAGLHDLTWATQPQVQKTENQFKFNNLDDINKKSSTCQLCLLCEKKTRPLHGEGFAASDLLIIAEAPHLPDSVSGSFLNASSRELAEKILSAMGLSLGQVFFSPIVRCQTSTELSLTDKRKAFQSCQIYLQSEVELVAPQVILVWGENAAQSFLGNDQKLEDLRGIWHEWGGKPVRVSYHPAALLRDPTLKRKAWEDMQEIVKKMGQGSRS